ncbi:MAG: hypothetical protein K2G27_05450 [Duncaniella sp.]|nr:hypothetical protein [Duncaniella sp.]
MLMHRTYRSLMIMAAATLLTAMTSCGSDSTVWHDDIAGEQPDVYLTLDVGVIDNTSMSSRSRAGSYYFELPERNNEKLNSLKIFIFNPDNNIIEGYRYVNFDSDGSPVGSNLTFKLKPGDKRIYLIANDQAVNQNIRNIYSNLGKGDVFPEDALNSATLSRGSQRPFFTSAQNIPMNESFDITLETPAEDESRYIHKTLFITRVAVKYTFIFADDVRAVTVGLDNMSTVQYFMPNRAVYSPAKYEPAETIDGITGRNITSFTAYPQDKSVFELTLTGKTPVEITEADGTKTTAYVYDPVYLMESSGSTFRVRVKLDAGETDAEGNSLEGSWYDYRQLPNLPLLPRNTHVLVRMSATYGLTCTVDVVPYRGCLLEPYFGLNRDEEGNLIPPTTNKL